MQPHAGTMIRDLDGTLRVQGDLGIDEEKAFASAIRGLVSSEHADLVIDLADVRYISSAYASEIALALVHAAEQGRSVTVRASDKVAHILSLCGIDALGKVEVVE